MNPDGNGYATLINGKVVFEKGVTIEDIWTKIKNKEIVSPCVIHCRITSVGKTTPELCHPFKVNSSGKNSNPMSGTLSKDESVLFHNGTMSDYKDLVLQTALGSGRHLPTGLMSDTRGLAYCLESLGIEALEYIDTGFNKFAVLNSKGLQKFGNWVNVNGIVSSNNYYAMTKISYGYGFDELNDFDNAFSKEDLCKTDKDAFDYHITPEYDPYKAVEADAIVKEAQEILDDVKVTKKEHKSNKDFLKKHGWKSFKTYSKLELRNIVDSMQTQKKLIRQIKKKKKEYFDKTNIDLDEVESSMSLDDYQDIRKKNLVK